MCLGHAEIARVEDQFNAKRPGDSGRGIATRNALGVVDDQGVDNRIAAKVVDQRGQQVAVWFIADDDRENESRIPRLGPDDLNAVSRLNCARPVACGADIWQHRID